MRLPVGLEGGKGAEIQSKLNASNGMPELNELKSALVQVMTWCYQARSDYQKQC